MVKTTDIVMCLMDWAADYGMAVAAKSGEVRIRRHTAR